MLQALYLSPNYCGRSSGSHQNFLFIPHIQYRQTNVLGSSLAEQMLKDYNGQTYWLSVNLHSFYKNPKWLNLAIGYGANGMLTGNGENNGLF
jgi:hypothetical protein